MTPRIPTGATFGPTGKPIGPTGKPIGPEKFAPTAGISIPARLRHALADRADRPDVNPARLRHALAERTDQHRDRPDIPGRIRHAIADRIDQHTDRPVDPRRVRHAVADRIDRHIDRPIDPGRVRHAIAERIDRNVDRPSRDDRSNRVRPVDLLSVVAMGSAAEGLRRSSVAILLTVGRVSEDGTLRPCWGCNRDGGRFGQQGFCLGHGNPQTKVGWR